MNLEQILEKLPPGEREEIFRAAAQWIANNLRRQNLRPDTAVSAIVRDTLLAPAPRVRFLGFAQVVGRSSHSRSFI